MSWFSFLSLLTTALLAASQVRQRTLKAQFIVQGITAAADFASLRLHAHARLYAWTYLMGELCIIESCIFVLREARISSKELLTALNFGLICCIVAVYGAPFTGWADLIPLIECGVATAFGMAFLLVEVQEFFAFRTLGALFLSLAIFDCGFARNDWVEANSWLPAAMCSTAFLAIAIKAARPEGCSKAAPRLANRPR